MTVKLGEQLRELRRQNARTQEELAAALGVTAQAVSRWEVGACYPDVEIIPALANYFGVSIDRLFGCDGERQRKIDELYNKLEKMNRENNGEDISMTECIAKAREALAEFPENEKLTFILAEILCNAGYVRYGEHHIKDAEGFDVFDVERHRGYDEWREAVVLYEKLLKGPVEPEIRHRATCKLSNLYGVTGEREKALALAETAPDIQGCRELLRLWAFSGKERAAAYREALLIFTDSIAKLMVNCEIAACASPERTAKRIEEMFSVVETVADGDYGKDNWVHALMAKEKLFLADRRWNAGDKEGAFLALDEALEQEKQSPGKPAALPEFYPWHCVAASVEEKIQDDLRWKKWVEKTRGER